MTSRQSLAKTLVASAILTVAAAPAIGQLSSNQLGTPNDGMVCRSSYSGALSGSAFKCTRSLYHTINLACTNPQFPNYVVRAGTSPNNPDGRDLCARNNVTIPSTGSLGGLVPNQDYREAAVDTNALNAEVERLRADETRSLGLDRNDVETSSSGPAIVVDGGNGSRDRATVSVTYYTFAVRTGPTASVATRN